MRTAAFTVRLTAASEVDTEVLGRIAHALRNAIIGAVEEHAIEYPPPVLVEIEVGNVSVWRR